MRSERCLSSVARASRTQPVACHAAEQSGERRPPAGPRPGLLQHVALDAGRTDTARRWAAEAELFLSECADPGRYLRARHAALGTAALGARGTGGTWHWGHAA